MTYEEAMHAVQSGVAYEQGQDADCDTRKHLRTGINSAAVTDAAVGRLLIAKGICTMQEYLEAVRLEAIAEVERYEKHLSAKFGVQITLG
jgi:hypothetical protein